MKTPRILIIRTDRMGDLILSTPVIRTLRIAFPQAYLAMMIAPAYRELLEGHPDLDAVLLYHKEGAERSWWGTIRYALKLKTDRFDTAIILHSTNRVIWVSLLAGIPQRIGYARRMRWALTHSLPYAKPEGTIHERDYNLRLLQLVGVSSPKIELSVSVSPSHQSKIDDFLHKNGVSNVNKVVLLHPGASCISKRWDLDKFARVGDSLKNALNCHVVVFTSDKDVHLGEKVVELMENRAISAFGIFSVGELALLLKRADCLISNDSGPVHLACAVGTPVVSIFGRWGGGLSPTRWGPTGERSIVLHKDVGCRPCLAHQCLIGFVCLKAISVEEVVVAAKQLLSLRNEIFTP